MRNNGGPCVSNCHGNFSENSWHKLCIDWITVSLARRIYHKTLLHIDPIILQKWGKYSQR